MLNNTISVINDTLDKILHAYKIDYKQTWHLGACSVFVGVCVAQSFSFLYCVVFFVFLMLSSLDCPSLIASFSNVYLYKKNNQKYNYTYFTVSHKCYLLQ